MSAGTPKNISITCPHCQAALAGPVSMIGTEVHCPGCKQPFTVPPEVKIPQSASSDPAPPDDDSSTGAKISIHCPHCRVSLEGPESMKGEVISCPGCEQPFIVPGKSTVSAGGLPERRDHTESANPEPPGAVSGPDEKIRITCPHCRISLVGPGAAVGAVISCPHCKEPFKVPETAPPPDEVLPGSRDDESTKGESQSGMGSDDFAKVEFACPHCQAALAGLETMIGKEVRCPGCEQPFTVPDPDHQPAVPVSPPVTHVEPRTFENADPVARTGAADQPYPDSLTSNSQDKPADEPPAAPLLEELLDASPGESLREDTIEKARSARSPRQLNLLSIGALAAAVVATALGLIAHLGKNRAAEQALIAETERKEVEIEKGTAFWLIGDAARAGHSDIKAGFNFLKAAQAYDLVDEQRHRENCELAAQFSTSGLVRTFTHDGEVRGFQENGDGSRILTWTEGGTLILWDVMKAERLKVWKHDSGINGAIFTKDNARALSWGGDRSAPGSSGEVVLWNVEEQEPIKIWRPGGGVRGAAFVQEESRFVTWGGKDSAKDELGEVILWSLVEDQPIDRWAHPKPVRGGVVSSDGKRILVWGEGLTVGSGNLALFDTVNLKVPLRNWEVSGSGWNGESNGAIFWPGQSTILIWDNNGLRSLDLIDPNAKPIRKSGVRINGGDFAGDGRRILSWDAGGSVELRNLGALDTTREWKHESGVSGAVFSADEARVLSWSVAGSIKLWDVEKDEMIEAWFQEEPIIGASFLHGETQIIVGSRDGSVRLWNVESMKSIPDETGTKKPSPRKLQSPIYTANKTRFLEWEQGPDDRGRIGKLELTDLTFPDLSKTFHLNGEIDGVVFSKDSSLFLAWSSAPFDPGQPAELGLWNVANSEPLQIWRHAGKVNGAAFTRDESRILAWDHSGSVKLWDVTKAEPIQEWPHEFSVSEAMLTPDESQLFTWSRDPQQRVLPDERKLWDVDLANEGLSTEERILKLEVRSGSRLDSKGQVKPLMFGEWSQKADEFAETQEKAK